MSAILIAIALQIVPPPEPLPEADVVVVAGKLRKLQLDVAMGSGMISSCAVKVTSGDSFIDGAACKGAYSCVRSGVTERQQLFNCINQRIVAAVAGQRADNMESRNTRAQNH